MTSTPIIIFKPNTHIDFHATRFDFNPAAEQLIKQ